MLLMFVSIGCQQKTTFLTHEAIGCLQKHNAFDICIEKTTLLTHEAIGCLQKNTMFLIFVSVGCPQNNDTFNT